MIRLQLLGRLTDNPEKRITQQGDTVCNFSVAVNMGKDQNGNDRPATFVKCSAWGARGETISNYFTKGQMIYVEGLPKADSWVNTSDNTPRGQLALTVQSFSFAGSKSDNQQPQSNTTGAVERLNKGIEPPSDSKPSEDPNPLPDVDIDSIQVQMPF